MRRILAVFILLITIAAELLYADSKFYKTYMSACFNVNLASTSYPKLNYSTYNINTLTNYYPTNLWSEGAYNNNTLVCIVGVSESEHKVRVKLDFDGERPWCYVSQSNNSNYRPFGIDLVGRIRTNYSGFLTQTLNLYHLGYQGSTYNTAEQTALLPRTNGDSTGSDYVNSGIVIDRKFASAWFDVVLVLDPFINTDTGLMIDPNNGKDITDNSNQLYGQLNAIDDYVTSFNITMEEVDDDGTVVGQTVQYHFDLSGYYDGSTTSIPTEKSYSFVVAPYASAQNVDIEGLKTSGAYFDVADYSFNTTSETCHEAQDTDEYYMFLSSSDDWTATGDYFRLKYISANGTVASTLNDANSVRFKIRAKSSRNSAEKVFDGKASRSNSSTWMSIPHVSNNTYNNAANGTVGLNHVYTDEGQYAIFFDADSITDNLLYGKYRSNIYCHIVTND